MVWTDPDLALDKERARAAAQALLEDERKFIDLGRSFLQHTTALFSSAQRGSSHLRPYDGPVQPVARQFPWFERIAPHVFQRAAPSAKL